MAEISLIIPTHNEEDYLPKLLDSVQEAHQRFSSDPSSIEVIVVDNQSTDNSAAIAKQRGCLVVEEKKRIIAAVRNAGARVAKSEIITFTDADNVIHPDTFIEIDKALSSPKVVGGATGVRLERMSLGIAVAYAIIVPMVWATRMDTGVVFCKKKDFENVGGYNESLKFAEDVEFLWRLTKLGRERGQRLTRLRKCKALNSTRKFDQFGDWHYVALLGKFFWSLFVRSYSLDKFAHTYWYSDAGSPVEEPTWEKTET